MAAERREDAADLVVGAADDRDRRQCGGFGGDLQGGMGVGGGQLDERADLRPVTILENEAWGVGEATGPGEGGLVAAGHPALWVREALNQGAVRRPEEQPRGVEVQAADGAKVAVKGSVSEEIVGRGMALVAQGGHDAARFVLQDDRAIPQRDRLFIDENDHGLAGGVPGRNLEVLVLVWVSVGAANPAFGDEPDRCRAGHPEVAREEIHQPRHRATLYASPAGRSGRAGAISGINFGRHMGHLHVALVAPEIHWNTGNAGRTCLAVDADLHLVRPLGFSLSDSHLRRAGLDYWPRVRVTVWADWAAFAAELPRLGTPFFFTARASRRYDQVDYPASTVLVFGSESVGLPAPLLDAEQDRTVSIPMLDPELRSLNLSTSVAVAAYEVRRRWFMASTGPISSPR